MPATATEINAADRAADHQASGASFGLIAVKSFGVESRLVEPTLVRHQMKAPTQCVGR